jgi:hypothetical protein
MTAKARNVALPIEMQPVDLEAVPPPVNKATRLTMIVEALTKMNEALAIVDRLGINIPGAHLSMAIETLAMDIARDGRG